MDPQSVYDKGTIISNIKLIPLRSNSERKIGFSPVPVKSLKNKTNTNQQRIGCLVYPENTQISEGSL